jgi:hypothetical protein
MSLGNIHLHLRSAIILRLIGLLNLISMKLKRTKPCLAVLMCCISWNTCHSNDYNDYVACLCGIKQLQWLCCVSLLYQTTTMTMLNLRAVSLMYGYLKMLSGSSIWVRNVTPDLAKLPAKELDWCHSLYGYDKGILPLDLSKQLGKSETRITYKSAKLYHDMMTGRSVSGIKYFCCQTLIDWYSKLHVMAESAMFGSEPIAERIACGQIMDLRMTLRYLGLPDNTRSYMFGDNQAVVTNSTIPHS